MQRIEGWVNLMDIKAMQETYAIWPKILVYPSMRDFIATQDVCSWDIGSQTINPELGNGQKNKYSYT